MKCIVGKAKNKKRLLMEKSGIGIIHLTLNILLITHAEPQKMYSYKVTKIISS